LTCKIVAQTVKNLAKLQAIERRLLQWEVPDNLKFKQVTYLKGII